MPRGVILGVMRGVLVLLSIAACGPSHIAIPPPQPGMTPDQRIAMFRQYAGVREHDVTTCMNHSCSTVQSIVFANDVEVHHPEDLLPLLPPDSAAARHIAARDDAETRQAAWAVPGVLAFGIGGVLYLRTASSDRPDATTERIGEVVMVAGLAAAFVGVFYAFRVREETSSAYATYTQGLAERLAVCVDGLALVPCEAKVAIAPR